MIIRRNNNFNFCKPFWKKYFIDKSKLRINENISNTFIRKKSLLTRFFSIFVLIMFFISFTNFGIISFGLIFLCFNSLISCLIILISCCKSLTVKSLDFPLFSLLKGYLKLKVDFSFSLLLVRVLTNLIFLQGIIFNRFNKFKEEKSSSKELDELFDSRILNSSF